MMFRRGLASCLVLAFASVTLGGGPPTATITLVPSDPGPYEGGESFTVEIRVSQDTGVLKLLRMMQIDLSDSHAGLVTGVSWLETAGHYLDTDLGAASFGMATASKTYYFTNENNLGPNADAQTDLPANGSAAPVGTLNVTLPSAPGTYRLDVMNSDNTDPNIGALVIFGHGIDEVGDPVTILRPGSGLLGGLINLVVPGGDADLVSSSPMCGQSLWRTRGNFILLTFDGPVSLPAAGQIQVRELLANGMYGTMDLASNFTMALEAGGTRLRMQEATGVDSSLVNRRWYGITENGWSGVNGFKVDVLVQKGDVNIENRVSSADASAINNVLCPQLGCGDDRREDVNGDRRISSADRSIVNGFLTGGAVIPQKPGGHTCNP